MTLQVPQVNIFSGSDSPWTSPKAWDSVTIGGVPYGPIFDIVSGKVRIRGAERFYKLDVKDPQGGNGSTTTFRGIRPRPFTIDFIMWTQLQYDYFYESFLPVLIYSGSNTSDSSGIQALSIDHPSLRPLNIVSIEVKSIGGLVPDRDGPETFRCSVAVEEYFPNPPVNVTKTPSGTTTTPPVTPGTSPVNAEIAANQARISRLNAVVNAQNPGG